MFLKSIFSLIFFLQYLLPISAKRSIIEVLHANQDVVTFNQFIKTDGLFRIFQQYGPVAFLSPINGSFECSLESLFRNGADEHLVNQAHLNLLTIGSRPAIGTRLLEYQIINGTCSTHAYNNETVRLGTYFYSKDASFVVQETVNDNKYSSLKTVSSDSWLTNGIIHVLEKPDFTNGLPLLLKTVAYKLVNEKNTSLLYEYNLGPLLNSVIHYATSLFPDAEESLGKDVSVQSGLSNNAMNVVGGIMDLGFIKALQRLFHKLLDSRFFEHHLKPTMNFLFSLSKRLGLSNFTETTSVIINDIHSTGNFENITSQNKMKQISQDTTSSPPTCPKEILDLKYGVCLNEPRFNDIFFNNLQSNGFSFSNMSILSKVELFCMAPKEQPKGLEYNMLIPSLEIIPRATFFSCLINYILWILAVFRCFFGFITHFRFVSGALSSLVLRPALLSWTQKTLERREQQVMARREYRLQRRQNWIAMRSSAPNTLSP